jgi:predicted nucleotidyltransferase
MPRTWEDEERRIGPWPSLDHARLTAAAEALAAACPAIEAIYLFGSRARGQTHAASDIDIAVLPAAPVPVSERISTQGVFARLLEAQLQVPVDVVLLRPDLSPGLLFDIFAVETILYARDFEQARRMASRARNEYRDLLPRLERAYGRVERRIEDWARATHRP